MRTLMKRSPFENACEVFAGKGFKLRFRQQRMSGRRGQGPPVLAVYLPLRAPFAGFFTAGWQSALGVRSRVASWNERRPSHETR